MRPILKDLGYTKTAGSSDSLIVNAIAAFIEDHLSSGGTRTKEAQASTQTRTHPRIDCGRFWEILGDFEKCNRI